ncbi:hypothetical protein [Bradyrhizobium commune]|uniref:Cysteine rich repeat protein n=1 Tax=Bradyrhizobium commune TaxID=83627 RepID=A0A7S9D0F3_9BRAD|nr:hypothetical protein [Bradyrhizobium commune]QPF88901.1 hypothetical protein IC761_20505 [Bradyrhizobium commune]
MFKFKIALAALLVASLGNSAAALAQEDRGTPEQRAACTSDAFRLCASDIPDPARVESCLRHRKLDLSEACRLVFDQGTSAAAVRAK